MPLLAQKAGVFKQPQALACLGAAALAATLLFTGQAAGAAEYEGELPAIQAETLPASLDDDAYLTAAVAARLEAASRSDVRTDLSANGSRVHIPNLVPQTPEALVDGELQPVAVTPAPIWCTFTGLGHLAETHELCTHPSQNTPEQNRALGEFLTAQRGWTGDQWQCMDNLMTRESRWRHNAANPVSAARGIPQKMMSVHYGANWRDSATAAAWLADPEAQIEWGLNYIERRYQTPCGAWGFFLRNGWY